MLYMQVNVKTLKHHHEPEERWILFKKQTLIKKQNF